MAECTQHSGILNERGGAAGMLWKKKVQIKTVIFCFKIVGAALTHDYTVYGKI